MRKWGIIVDVAQVSVRIELYDRYLRQIIRIAGRRRNQWGRETVFAAHCNDQPLMAMQLTGLVGYPRQILFE